MEIIDIIFQSIKYVIDLFLHLDVYLQAVISDYGVWTYAILFIVLFCETGLVVTPILPGDSLLFAAGAFVALGSLELFPLLILLCIAAILGDAVNYAIGKYFGEKLMTKYPKVFKKEYIEKTQSFYERYGGKTIIFARFVPIVRTFAPFLAGVAKMKYRQFVFFNISGALAWIFICVLSGFYFGNIPIVKKNFTLVILAIIFVSILPAAIEIYRSKKTLARV